METLYLSELHRSLPEDELVAQQTAEEEWLEASRIQFREHVPQALIDEQLA